MRNKILIASGVFVIVLAGCWEDKSPSDTVSQNLAIPPASAQSSEPTDEEITLNSGGESVSQGEATTPPSFE